MKDRNVEFPNRFRMTKVDGTDDIYDIIPAPGEVIAPGDTFSKANMLPDSIPAALGLKMGNPQVKDALNVLAHVGNLHVWERVQTLIEASYVENKVRVSDAQVFASDYQSSSYYAKFNVADSIDISSDGVISLVSPTQVTVYFQDGYLYYFNSLKGKYISLVSTASNSSSSFPGAGNIGYVSSDAEVSIAASSYYQAKITSGAYKVYSVFVPAGTTTDYLTSTDRNAYPDKSAEGGQDAYYSLGDVVSGNIINAAGSVSVGFYYSDTISVDSEGNIIIPTTNTISLYDYKTTNTDTIKGKFIKLYTSNGDIVPFSGVIYIPSDSVFSINSGLYCSAYQPVTGHAAIPAHTTITYLGQLGEPGAKIEVGSYVGTGTYGKTNPNSLTFGFEPKMVAIFSPANNGNYAYKLFMLRNVLGASVLASDGNNNGVIVTWSEKSVTWYLYESKTVSYQMNGSGVIYNYIAIG